MERWQIGTFILILLLLSGLAIVMSEAASPTGNGKEVNATCAVMQYATRENASGAFQCGSASNTNYLTTQTAVSTEVSASCTNKYAVGENVNGSFICSSVNTPCTYFLTSISGLISAFLCNGNIVTFTSAPNGNASKVLNAVFSSSQCSTGCDVFLSAGTYPLNVTVTNSNNGVTLDGLGVTSKITVVKNFNANLFTISGANNLVRNLGINATGVQQTQTFACIQFTGVNDTAYNTYLLNCNHGAIRLSASRDQAVLNRIVNSSDDGIIAGTGGCCYNILQNYVSYTTNFNCISVVSTTNSIVALNQLFHCGQDGIGIENLGSGANTFLTVSQNTVTNITQNCIVVYVKSGSVESADDTQIVNNNMQSCGTLVSNNAIQVNSGNRITASFNTMNTVSGACIIYNGNLQGAVSFNTIKNCGTATASDGIRLTNGTQTKVDSNSVFNPTNACYDLQGSAQNDISFNNDNCYFPKASGIATGVTTKNLTISSPLIDMNKTSALNCIDFTGATTQFSINGGRLENCQNGIIIRSTSGKGIVSSISLTGNGNTGTCLYDHGSGTNVTWSTNTCESFGTGLKEDSGTDSNYWVNNNLANSVTTKTSLTGNRSIVIGNLGYNQIGVISNFVFSGGSGTGDGNYISPIGTTSTLVASTAYTVSRTPVLILIQAIGLSTISINGGSAITPTIGEVYYLQPRQTINFGAFGLTPPTLQVIFS